MLVLQYQKWEGAIVTLPEVCGMGLTFTVDGFRVSMKAMEQMAQDKPGKKEPPPVSFNDHD